MYYQGLIFRACRHEHAWKFKHPCLQIEKSVPDVFVIFSGRISSTTNSIVLHVADFTFYSTQLLTLFQY